MEGVGNPPLLAFVSSWLPPDMPFTAELIRGYEKGHMMVFRVLTHPRVRECSPRPGRRIPGM